MVDRISYGYNPTNWADDAGTWMLSKKKQEELDAKAREIIRVAKEAEINGK